ncbi:uncharacterized protein C7orf26 homolog [Teleopsis dalmanni]|nr:uncharacterized protein C7orf26 homolog [Teleopsis dalmanni]
MSDKFRDLPITVSHFAANFMTAVAELYFNDQHGALVAPPERLLDVIANWISENPNLCYACYEPIALPQGAIAMPVVTSISGLLRWTILAPLVTDKVTYKKLHLYLIQSIINNKGSNQSAAIDAQHMQIVINSLLLHASRSVPASNDDPAFQTCIERLSQAVHTAINSQAIYGNIPQLLCSLQTLPHNEFLSTVIKMHKIKI